MLSYYRLTLLIVTDVRSLRRLFIVSFSSMSAQSSPRKNLRTLEASDLGEMLIDAVSRHDKKVAKTALKSGACCRMPRCICARVVHSFVHFLLPKIIFLSHVCYACATIFQTRGSLSKPWFRVWTTSKPGFQVQVYSKSHSN